MSETPDLDVLLSSEKKPRSAGGRSLPPEVQELRSKECVRRYSKAQQLAFRALSRLHRDDYQMLLEQAKAKIHAERGPLPGDEERS